MRIIFAILFAVIFGLIGARFAGPFVDWLIGTQAFESPDQVAYFDLVARLVVTSVVALIGVFLGILVAGRLRGRLIRRES
jgi:ABC-type multidrug transport system fused ATPase/permease subunit